MAAMSASSVTFKTAVAPRMRCRAAKLTRATRGSVATRASVVKISVNEVKDHLDRGFVLVDIRDPDEARETGYKSSWKNIVVRTFACPRAPGPGVRPDYASLPAAKTQKPTRSSDPPPRDRPAARRHGRGRADPHEPELPRADSPEFLNTMSRILIACDDGTTRSEKAAAAIVENADTPSAKSSTGGVDAYLKAYPLTQADKVKWKMRPEIGEDLSVLVSGVDTRQAGQKYY